MKRAYTYRVILVLAFGMLAANWCAAQTFSISGSTCVVAGGTLGYVYTLSGSYQSTDNLTWTVTGGTITPSGGTSKSGTVAQIGIQLKVIWDVGTSTSGTIQCYDSRLGTKSLSVTKITIATTATPSSQSVGYGTSATITGGGPNSSACSPAYSFRWESGPTSSGPFNSLGVTSQNLTVSPVQQSAYYRRGTSFNGETVYTPVVSISVPPLNPGSISASVTSIAYNTQPSITQTAGSGGSCSSLTYEWQQSVEGSPWRAIGASAAYPSGAPAVIGTTRIRRKVTCGNQVLFTNELVFTTTYTSANKETSQNYIRTNDIWMPGINSFAQADQLSIGNKQQT
ncbi:MAG TPA: hypothetical protein VG870_05480, partial [Chitinophagaceae bacterium]|nr:hypothetical protein [Chitinophagaceae bacterium]